MLSQKSFVDEFVKAIDAKLATQGRQWVFIFDQIDHLSAHYHNIRDISTLPFPFNYMHEIMKPGWITCILSALANNQLLLHHDNNHSDFHKYRHCLSFSKKEVLCAFALVRSFNDEVIESIMAKTDGVPLQVQDLLLHQRKEGDRALNFEQYERDVRYSIKVDVSDLEWQDQWWDNKCFPEVTQNACCCLLAMPLTQEPRNYD